MHEPSPRPFARREHNNVVGRKTVSVKGHWDFEQAAGGCHVSKFHSFQDSKVPRTGALMKTLGRLETLKPVNRETSFF
jgi:hypothetical protein